MLYLLVGRLLTVWIIPFKRPCFLLWKEGRKEPKSDDDAGGAASVGGESEFRQRRRTSPSVYTVVSVNIYLVSSVYALFRCSQACSVVL